MTAPLEVLPEPCPWSEVGVAQAYLLGYVRTDAPGYREIVEDPLGGANLRVVASGERRFDDYIDAINAAFVDNDTWYWGPGGPDYADRGAVEGSENELVSGDRLAWLCGFGAEAGATFSDGRSIFVPPAGIPLMGATWDYVTEDAERQIIIDRHRRNQGFIWGGASIVRCSMTMHRWALGALMTGWCLRGRVTLGGAAVLDDTSFASGNPAGPIHGYALGLDGASWADRTQRSAHVDMSIVLTPE